MDPDSHLRQVLAEATARIMRLEDKWAILDTLYRYHHAVGQNDRERWLDCFTRESIFALHKPDGQRMFELRGRAEQAAWYDKRMTKWPPGTEAHAYVNPLITVEGDRATASGVFITMQMESDKLILRSTGEYVDRLVRCKDDKWRIEERRAITKMAIRGFLT